MFGYSGAVPEWSTIFHDAIKDFTNCTDLIIAMNSPSFDPVTRSNVLPITPTVSAKVVTRDNVKSTEQYRAKPAQWTYLNEIPKPEPYLKLVNEYFIGITDKRNSTDDRSKSIKKARTIDKKKLIELMYKTTESKSKFSEEA